MKIAYGNNGFHYCTLNNLLLQSTEASTEEMVPQLLIDSMLGWQWFRLYH